MRAPSLTALRRFQPTRKTIRQALRRDVDTDNDDR